MDLTVEPIDQFQANMFSHLCRLAFPSKRKNSNKLWRAKNKIRACLMVRNSWKKNRDRNRLWILGYLKANPCIKCGEPDPVVLQFDHRDNEKKYLNISLLVNQGFALQTLIAEVAKCDVLCANCHQRRTVCSRNWWKALI